jgi:hypothetical protein
MACRGPQVAARVGARNLFTTTRQMPDIGWRHEEESAYTGIYGPVTDRV